MNEDLCKGVFMPFGLTVEEFRMQGFKISYCKHEKLENEGHFEKFFKKATKIFPQEFSDKIVKINHPRAKRDYLLSRALIYQITEDWVASDREGVLLWPEKVIGSLTHKSGFAAVAIGKPTKRSGMSVGIDMESISRMKNQLASGFLNNEEIAHITGYADSLPMVELLTIAFSFKESIFKAHYPIGRKRFYFHDAQLINIDLDAGEIQAKIKIQTSPHTPEGHVVKGKFCKFPGSDTDMYFTTAVEPMPEKK